MEHDSSFLKPIFVKYLETLSHAIDSNKDDSTELNAVRQELMSQRAAMYSIVAALDKLIPSITANVTAKKEIDDFISQQLLARQQ